VLFGLSAAQSTAGRLKVRHLRHYPLVDRARQEPSPPSKIRVYVLGVKSRMGMYTTAVAEVGACCVAIRYAWKEQIKACEENGGYPLGRRLFWPRFRDRFARYRSKIILDIGSVRRNDNMAPAALQRLMAACGTRYSV
jgi:hypothetical protein